MTEQEFLQKYNTDKPSLLSWGNFVKERIEILLKQVLKDEPISEFLKIPVIPRLKGEDSILEKAFLRNKNYQDPYKEITDKIGIRFVVLLDNEIELIQQIVESIQINDLWNHSKDRDFEEERRQNPLVFDYQSVHYIIRSKGTQQYNNSVIAEGTPCEIQIRTLLQHAYSELTHKTVYKKNLIEQPEIKRSIARSMALIETTGKIFSEVNDTINESNGRVMNFLNDLKKIFSSVIDSPIEDKINSIVLDAYKDELNTISIEDIIEFVKENPYLHNTIKSKSISNVVYRQPVILFIYYLIKTKRTIFESKWPFTPEESRSFFIDLAISPGD